MQLRPKSISFADFKAKTLAELDDKQSEKKSIVLSLNSKIQTITEYTPVLWFTYDSRNIHTTALLPHTQKMLSAVAVSRDNVSKQTFWKVSENMYHDPLVKEDRPLLFSLSMMRYTENIFQHNSDKKLLLPFSPWKDRCQVFNVSLGNLVESLQITPDTVSIFYRSKHSVKVVKFTQRSPDDKTKQEEMVYGVHVGDVKVIKDNQRQLMS
jgi:hypothetical protein